MVLLQTLFMGTAAGCFLAFALACDRPPEHLRAYYRLLSGTGGGSIDMGEQFVYDN